MAYNGQLKRDETIRWLDVTPFIISHLAPLGLFYTGLNWWAVTLCIFFYFFRMFFVTGAMHRYFSHRSYQMGRVMQFLMAVGGTLTVQKGVLWWAAHHRHHHRYSDQEEDIHSPKRGFIWAHIGWIVCEEYNDTQEDLIPDFLKFPELRWLNNNFMYVQVAFATAIFFSGYFLYGNLIPVTAATGAWMAGTQTLLAGFFLSTVFLWHGTFCINSFTHIWGRRRFATRDTSRNSFILALVTGGEGWHNNHHHYQAACRQGLYWWEVDWTFYILWTMSKVGLVKNLRKAPERIVNSRRIAQQSTDIGLILNHIEQAEQALVMKMSNASDSLKEQQQAIVELLQKTKNTIEEISFPGNPAITEPEMQEAMGAS
ncbi:MAG: fatty acid desaturase [Planctomycetes bacterium]|nr:fatty acid desaturase [Planctomycetota bacterium]